MDEPVEIELTRGKVAIIDADDYELVSKHKWHATYKDYAATTIFVNGKAKPLIMHRLIIGCSTEEQVDHINGNSLDNRRCNLRICTHGQNQMNRGLQRNNKSGFKGVSFSKYAKRWRAFIQSGGVKHSLGYFKTPEEAYEAYKAAALKLHGSFSFLSSRDDEHV